MFFSPSFALVGNLHPKESHTQKKTKNTPEVEQMDPFGYIASFIFNGSLLMLSRLHVMFFLFIFLMNENVAL